jgi:hypothetical protein
VVRHALGWPLHERGLEGVLQRLLGDVPVAEQADQRGERVLPLGPDDVRDAVDARSIARPDVRPS